MWTDAEILCQGRGGYLAELQDQNEFGFVIEYLYDNVADSDTFSPDFWWLGATDEAQPDWTWIHSREIVAYNEWHETEPKDLLHCMMMKRYSEGYVYYAWQSARCSASASFICEAPYE